MAFCIISACIISTLRALVTNRLCKIEFTGVQFNLVHIVELYRRFTPFHDVQV